MHFIQNNWFADNWLWLLMLGTVGMAVIAYLNNRLVLLRRSLMSLLGIFMLTVTLSFSGVSVGTLSPGNSLMEKMTSETADVKSPDLISKVFTFMLDALKDRIAD